MPIAKSERLTVLSEAEQEALNRPVFGGGKILRE